MIPLIEGNKLVEIDIFGYFVLQSDDSVRFDYLDIFLKKWDIQSTYAFLKRLHKNYRRPKECSIYQMCSGSREKKAFYKC